jgi:hexosaminidase
MSRVPRFAVPALLAIWLSAPALAQEPAAALLPMPQSIVAQQGSFAVSARTAILAASDDERRAAERFADLLGRTTGTRLTVGGDAGPGIAFRTVAGMRPESYRLEVSASGATITASDYAGLFYGGVTLWQLLTARPGLAAEAVVIEDGPRFGWRGLMLDSARHFQPPEFVMQLIDWMAASKLNRFHWHLTDDQGWRIQINRYPRLTEVGAWRVPATAPGAPTLPHTGGYYTQDQIREIVAYARERAIEIVPEIDMPGHALAAVRAYPELGTGVVPPPGIESDWGVFPYLYNVEDGTFTFLENVLDEVLALFPGTYIHIGGDEAVKDQWRASPQIQARMRALGIADEAALQSWFMARIGRFLDTRGRRLIGWDEILEGGIPASATIMSWRGIDGAVHAARVGHDAVLSPAPVLYLNHRQAGGPEEPPGRGQVVSLADVYAFDPAPLSLTPDEQGHILGLQANMWTEHARTGERVTSMIFPRALAVAELGWSQRATHDYAGFVRRLVPQLERLGTMGLRPSVSAFRPVASERLDPAANRVVVTLSNQAETDVRYTLDGSTPTAASPLYAAPLNLALPARLRAAGFLGADALPGGLDRTFDAASVQRRDDTRLKLCTESIALSLEDDAPADGPRAVFLTDIQNPCWIYEDAPLDGVTGIEIDVGQIPFNFQIGRDIERIRFRPPATPGGEMEVRVGTCEGERIAVLPLGPAAANPAVTRLRAPIVPQRGRADLCFTYTATGPNPMWAIDAVQLVPGS